MLPYLAVQYGGIQKKCKVWRETQLDPIRNNLLISTTEELSVTNQPLVQSESRQAVMSYLSTVLGDELVFLDWLFDEDAPTGHIRRGQQQMLRHKTSVSF